MCDHPLPVTASRAVSVREFTRSPAAIVGEVELDGSVVVLSRNGRMVALLTPLPERTVVEFHSEGRMSSRETEDLDSPDDFPELEPMAKQLLAAALAADPMPIGLSGFAYDRGCTASAAAIAFGELELDGLMENGMRGRRLTREGVKVARWLDSREDAPS